jgi:drug/metabolite transporter (DMT)-like permease
MFELQMGEFAAVGTALLWTLSAVAWTTAGRHVGALVVSFVRLLVATVLLAVHGLLFRGLVLPTDATYEQWRVLGLSGFLGFFLADLLLFKAFLMIGPRRSLLLYSLTPPFTALGAWIGMQQPLGIRSWMAMAITLAGVTWVVSERSATAESSSQRTLILGICLALLASLIQALSSLMAQQGIGQYDAVAATFIRVLGGVVGFLPLILVTRRSDAVMSALRNAHVMRIITCGAIVGPYLGVVLYLIALRHCHAGIVTTIVATMPVLILPFSVFLLRETVTPRAVAGALLSVLGVGLLVS